MCPQISNFEKHKKTGILHFIESKHKFKNKSKHFLQYTSWKHVFSTRVINKANPDQIASLEAS